MKCLHERIPIAACAFKQPPRAVYYVQIELTSHKLMGIIWIDGAMGIKCIDLIQKTATTIDLNNEQLEQVYKFFQNVTKYLDKKGIEIK